MAHQTWVWIGRLDKPHGLHGGAKVRALRGLGEILGSGSALRLVPPGLNPVSPPPRLEETALPQETLALHLSRAGRMGNHYVIHPREWQTVEDAEPYRGWQVYVMQEALPAAEEDEYYIHDLIGLAVSLRAEDGSESELGTLEEIIATGANDVFVVRGPRGEVLVPAIEDAIAQVDLPARRMVVHDLPGMIEDDLDGDETA